MLAIGVVLGVFLAAMLDSLMMPADDDAHAGHCSIRNRGFCDCQK